MGHKYRLVVGAGDDSPGMSLDEVFWCQACGTVKHDHRHNGGQRSPNYPVYFVVGFGSTPSEPPCKES